MRKMNRILCCDHLKSSFNCRNNCKRNTQKLNMQNIQNQWLHTRFATIRIVQQLLRGLLHFLFEGSSDNSHCSIACLIMAKGNDAQAARFRHRILLACKSRSQWSKMFARKSCANGLSSRCSDSLDTPVAMWSLDARDVVDSTATTHCVGSLSITF